MLIDRYLIGEIGKPLLVVCTVTAAIFASYSSAQFLADAAAGTLMAEAVAKLIALKVVVAMEVLLPVALYLTVVLGLGRLHADQEMTVLSACGVSPWRVHGAVLRLAVPVALLVALLSLYGRPWAYQQSYQLKARAEEDFNVAQMQPGRFYDNPRGNRVLMAEGVDRDLDRLTGVFISSQVGDKRRVAHARQAYRRVDPDSGTATMVLVDGSLYLLDRDGSKDRVTRFGEMRLHLTPRRLGYKRKAAQSLDLASSSDPQDVAELQWRLSTPVTTLLLSMLAVQLSRAAPRGGRYAKLLVAVAIFALIYQFGALVKTWVEQGLVAPFPGIWWLDVLLVLVLATFLWRPAATFLRRRAARGGGAR